MKAEKFIEVWKEFVGQEKFLVGKEIWQQAWYKNKEWTGRTIGYACAVPYRPPTPTEIESENESKNEGNSPLGKFLLAELGPGWRCQKEFKHVDLVIARKENIRRPYSWQANDQVEWDSRFHPIIPEILIEQESSCGISWQEMEKLILLRSRLKVLITYTSDADSNGVSQNHIDETRKQLKDMLEAAWHKCPEFEETEYLLIIGQLDESQNKANWHCTIFSPRGTRVPDEAWMNFSTPSEDA
ncbi:MAG: hypothetical protein KF843_03150 [Flavobacteriales bacterium]|nr:hypothetical protein [Flavobacteriales bacterium]